MLSMLALDTCTYYNFFYLQFFKYRINRFFLKIGTVFNLKNLLQLGKLVHCNAKNVAGSPPEWRKEDETFENVYCLFLSRRLIGPHYSPHHTFPNVQTCHRVIHLPPMITDLIYDLLFVYFDQFYWFKTTLLLQPIITITKQTDTCCSTSGNKGCSLYLFVLYGCCYFNNFCFYLIQLN